MFVYTSTTAAAAAADDEALLLAAEPMWSCAADDVASMS
jgi:hypothetical protein